MIPRYPLPHQHGMLSPPYLGQDEPAASIDGIRRPWGRPPSRRSTKGLASPVLATAHPRFRERPFLLSYLLTGMDQGVGVSKLTCNEEVGFGRKFAALFIALSIARKESRFSDLDGPGF